MIDKLKSSEMFKWVVGLTPLITSVVTVILLFFVTIPPENKDIAMALTGLIFAWGGAVVSYQFGATNPPKAVTKG